MHLALATGRKAFYTTPIKALSNQKYHDLVRRHGADNVGLLTGDSSVNGEAPDRRHDHRGAAQHDVCRVAAPSTGSATSSWTRCTTSPTGSAERCGRRSSSTSRATCRLVSLSATVSQRRGVRRLARRGARRHEVVVSEHRPVPLWQHMLVGTGMFDLFVDEAFDPSNAPDGGVDALRDAAPTPGEPAELLQVIASLSRRSP